MRPLSAQTRTAMLAGGVVIGMGALSFASVPLYRLFCQITGFAGTPGVAEAAPDVVLDQTMIVRFDANRGPDMPWSFRPVVNQMVVRLGEENLAFYEAHNPTDQVIGGRAMFNLTPEEAGGYLVKIECFCFTEQVLQPGQTVQMPVSFFIDPAILDDRDAQFIHTITLSYTFYPQDLPPDMAQALTAGDGPAIETN